MEAINATATVFIDHFTSLLAAPFTWLTDGVCEHNPADLGINTLGMPPSLATTKLPLPSSLSAVHDKTSTMSSFAPNVPEMLHVALPLAPVLVSRVSIGAFHMAIVDASAWGINVIYANLDLLNSQQISITHWCSEKVVILRNRYFSGFVQILYVGDEWLVRGLIAR